MTPKLSIVIVNYRSADVVEHLLRSLHVAIDASVEIIVVDNSPEDGAKKKLAASGFHGHYFPQTSNIGYPAAVNFGAAHAIGDYLCLVHPDVLFEAQCLDRLLKWIEQHPRSVAGPRQKNAQGEALTSVWPTMGRRTIWGPAEHQGSPWSRASQPYMSWLHPNLRFSRHNRSTQHNERVPVLDSSCLVMPRAIWEDVGGLNEDLHYVGLESEWFTRAKELGIMAWYIPEAEIFHQQAVSISRADAWQVRELTNRDRRWYARRLGFVAIVILGIVLWLERKLRPHDAP